MGWKKKEKIGWDLVGMGGTGFPQRKPWALENGDGGVRILVPSGEEVREGEEQIRVPAKKTIGVEEWRWRVTVLVPPGAEVREEGIASVVGEGKRRVFRRMGDGDRERSGRDKGLARGKGHFFSRPKPFLRLQKENLRFVPKQFFYKKLKKSPEFFQHATCQARTPHDDFFMC